LDMYAPLPSLSSRQVWGSYVTRSIFETGGTSVGPIFDLPLFNVSTDTMYCIKISIYLYFVAVKLSTIINLFKLYFSFFCYNVQHIYDTVYMFLFRCTDSIVISNVILFNYH